MQEKKIATSVDLLINVGQYEHIQITKYAETKIEYNSKEDMVAKEDQLTTELVDDIIRTMRGIPERLGKKTTAVSAIEERIQKKIPEWLNNSTEAPNLARKKFEDNQAKESALREEQKSDISELLGDNTKEDKSVDKSVEESAEDDLFKDM